jgi:transposase-like protein
MSRQGDQRQFSREFKLAAVSRMAAGENVSALSRELGVARKCLYQWRDRVRLGGAVALRSRGRMTKAERLQMQSEAVGAEEVCAPPAVRRRHPPPAPPEELARARDRIAELERKIGRQQLELDFFQRALRHVREVQPPSGGPGGTASTRSSKG